MIRTAFIDGWRPRARTHGQNARVHWRTRAASNKIAREKVGMAMLAAGIQRGSLTGRATVEISVTARRGQPDSDNVQGMAKSLRDAIAEWFGVDDSPSSPITWEYEWQRGPDGVTIVIEED